jgi:hypothetical protein
MLPDFRFLIGAVLATGMLGVAGFGLATAVRLSHEARVGPSEASRSLAFDDRADWNQFSDPEFVRRFERLAHHPDEAATTPASDAAATAGAPLPAVAPSISEAPARDEPAANAPADMDTHVAMAEERPAELDQRASPDSEASAAAIAPVVAEPVAVAPAAEPLDPSIVVADTGAPTTAEVATAPTAVEIAVAPTPVETTAEPVAAERLASTSAAVPDEPAEIEQPAIPPNAARSAPQLRTPLPKPKPLVAKRIAKAKVAKAAKARPRPAVKPPAASTGYAAPNTNDPWGNGKFFQQ